MSCVLAGVNSCKLMRSTERQCRTYFDRNASLGSRIPTYIKYYFDLLFLRMVMVGGNRNSHEAGVENPKARDHLVHTGSGLSMILKWFLNEYGWKL
jgi:hypothetical protein